MNKVNILDCTLRDGGYVNDWQFGKDNIEKIIIGLEKAKADVIELGFLRDEQYSDSRAVFSNMKEVKKILKHKREGAKYAVLVEMANYYPLEQLERAGEGCVDIIRYSFWKRKLEDALCYAKRIVDMGYELFVQPTRAEQYTEAEFKQMVLMFGELNPKAIYIVDTFGLLSKEEVEKYAFIAHQNMPRQIMLGYHAHNNMQQAIGNASHLIELGLDRKLIIDSSVFGMGRGAGNLNTEILMNYLNKRDADRYEPDYCYEIYDECLKPIYDRNPWGYSLAYYLTALYRCNPSYASYFLKNGYSVIKMKKILERIPYEEKIRYSEDVIMKYQ